MAVILSLLCQVNWHGELTANTAVPVLHWEKSCMHVEVSDLPWASPHFNSLLLWMLQITF